MDYMKHIQILLELWSSGFCMIAGICLLLSPKEKNKSAIFLIILEFICAIYMVTDAFAWIYDGTDFIYSNIIVHCSNFMLYLSDYLLVIFMGSYIASKIQEGGYKGKCKWKYIIYGLNGLCILLLIISQFNGLFYHISESNAYSRGSWYILSQMLPVAAILIAVAGMFLQRNYVTVITRIAISTFVLLPAVAIVYQTFHYGYAYTGLATALSFLLVFAGYEIDIDRFHSAANTEKENTRGEE